MTVEPLLSPPGDHLKDNRLKARPPSIGNFPQGSTCETGSAVEGGTN